MKYNRLDSPLPIRAMILWCPAEKSQNPLGFGLRLVASGPVGDPNATMVTEQGLWHPRSADTASQMGKSQGIHILIHTTFRSV